MSRRDRETYNVRAVYGSPPAPVDQKRESMKWEAIFARMELITDEMVTHEKERQDEAINALIKVHGTAETIRRLKLDTFRDEANNGNSVLFDGREVWRGWWHYDHEKKTIEWREIPEKSE